jgi:hypothetical protein
MQRSDRDGPPSGDCLSKQPNITREGDHYPYPERATDYGAILLGLSL